MRWSRLKYLGPVLWIGSIQYFVIQIVVAAAWPTPYSWKTNVISDLGNTACRLYGGRYVCSPLHGLMNVTFVVQGLLVVGGSLMIAQWYRHNRAAMAGFLFMGLAGVGSALVGLAPENRLPPLHTAGAILPFYLGNVALLIFGLALTDISRALRVLAFSLGSVALMALVFFSQKIFFGLGPGGMERVVAYPQTIWTFVFGLYLARRYNVMAQIKLIMK